MSNRQAIIEIEHNDSDRRFRDKCNSNFRRLAAHTSVGNRIAQVIGDGDSSLADKVSIGAFDAVVAELRALIATRLQRDQLLAGPGITLTRTGDNITVNAATIVVPVIHSSVTVPANGSLTFTVPIPPGSGIVTTTMTNLMFTTTNGATARIIMTTAANRRTFTVFNQSATVQTYNFAGMMIGTV